MAQPTLKGLTQQLVQALIPELKDDRPTIIKYTSRVVKDIKADVIGTSRKEWPDIRNALYGLSQTAKIRVQDDLAEALEKNLENLERCRRQGETRWNDEGELDMRNLPQYVHLLLNLAGIPSVSTQDFAYAYLNRVPPSGPTADQILYQQIMEEEPFDAGEEWDEEVHSGWSDSDDELEQVYRSDQWDSPEEEDIRTPSSAIIRTQRKKEEEYRRNEAEEDRRQEALEVVRGLKDQYWNTPGSIREFDHGLYGWKDLITRIHAQAQQWMVSDMCFDQAISSAQLQREILFILSGRSGIIFEFSADGTCDILPDHPLVDYLSPSSLSSLLNTFKVFAQQAADIRAFVNQTFRSSIKPTPDKPNSRATGPSRTEQAFAEACQGISIKLDRWLSDLEASFTLGSSPASSSKSVSGGSSASTPSLLLLELEASYAHMLDYLNSFIPHSSNSTVLLNLIYSAIQNHRNHSNDPHRHFLLHLFIKTAKPTWNVLGEWLHHGMPVPSSLTNSEEIYSATLDEGKERLLEQEFFIKRDRDVSWADEDFYECGFVVADNGWPDWIGHDMGILILESGKAKGLLRSLGTSVNTEDSWPSLDQLLDGQRLSLISQSGNETEGTLPFDIMECVADHIRPICQITQYQLRRVIDEECGLEAHLDAIEGLYFNRGFSVIDEWCQLLFNKVSKKEKWSDFHTLTSTFRDTIEEEQAGWMNPGAIRIRTVRSAGAFVGPRALCVIRADYEVPFPLSQLISATSIELRAEIFTFILQLRSARYLLSQTKLLDRAALSETAEQTDTRSMRKMRQKLTWIVDTIYIWLTDRVIEVENNEYRRQLSDMTSLSSMIALELEYTRKLRKYAFQHTSTSEIYEYIQDIFDMTYTLSECFNSYIVQQPAQSQTATKRQEDFVTRRRPRPRPKQRHTNRADSSDEDEDDQVPKEASISFIELGLDARMRRMGKDLDNLVQQIKEEVDDLSMESIEEEGGRWGMLAFALEDWK
uniref:Spindle pole body component n=1 Tax=Kwoniella pini CBS 10737 TaxID=1296096 RepID=A0A1B9I6P9_9TREE|nr:uncharacterized protein I206_03268 [Kwoniella pini CBS 10737]OCF51202.1 hypothetical protein I206_03268 [Kwoniella pini CBS 10737]